jgi:hypothetical protein
MAIKDGYPVQSFQLVGANYKFDFLSQNNIKWLLLKPFSSNLKNSVIQ